MCLAIVVMTILGNGKKKKKKTFRGDLEEGSYMVNTGPTHDPKSLCATALWFSCWSSKEGQ